MDPNILLAIVLAFIGIGISIVIWLASTHAAKIQEQNATPSAYLKSVDAEAYERAKRIYEAAIDQLQDEVDRLNQQLRDFQAEILRLNSEVLRLRRKMIDNGDDSGPQPTV